MKQRILIIIGVIIGLAGVAGLVAAIWLQNTPTDAGAAIAEQRRHPTEAFLRQFPTAMIDLQTFHHIDPETGYVYEWDGTRVDDVPPFFRLQNDATVRDRAGNVLFEGLPFMRYGAVATQFNLFNLDDSGFPVITVLFAFETWGWHEIYRFVYGEYRFMGTVPWPRFFRDAEGRLIMGSHEIGAPGRHDGLHYVTWEGIRMHLHTIIGHYGNYWENGIWQNFITGLPSAFCLYTDDWANPPDVPYTPFTPVQPLTELENQMREAILQTLE